MRPQLFYSRPLRHIADQLVQLTDTVSIALDEGTDELAGVALAWSDFVVTILAIIFSRPIELDDVLHQPLLTDGGRSAVNTMGHPLHAFASAHVLH